jgi:hypothetical protein
MPTTKKAAAVKKAAKAIKRTAPAEEESNGTGGRRVEIDLKQAKQVARMRDNGQSWAEISEELEIGTGKAMLLNLYARVEDEDRITGTEAQVARQVVKVRNDGYSWGAIMARTGMGEQKLRRMYEEATGETTKGNRIGKGGRYPGDVKPDDDDAPVRKSTAKKAGAAKKAAKVAKGVAKAGKAGGAAERSVNEDGNHPLVDMPLPALKQRLEGKKVGVRRDSGRTEHIRIRTIKSKTRDGEMVFTDDNGKTRTVLITHIASATK